MMFVFMMVAATAAMGLFMRCAVMMLVTGDNRHLMLHSAGNLRQLLHQFVGIFSSKPQLLGSEGNGCLLYLRQGIEFIFHFGCAVGTAKIFDDIDFLFHMYPPYRNNT